MTSVDIMMMMIVVTSVVIRATMIVIVVILLIILVNIFGLRAVSLCFYIQLPGGYPRAQRIVGSSMENYTLRKGTIGWDRILKSLFI